MTKTLTIAGVVAEVGVTESQLPPLLVAAEARKFKFPPMLDTARACAAGAGPPVVCVNDSAPGDTAMVAEGVIVRVTASVCGLLGAAPAATTTDPVYVPADSPGGITEIFRLLGVAPKSGPAESQLPPELVVNDTVKLTAVPSVLVTDAFWVAVAVLPTGNVKTSAPGLTTNNAVFATVKVTGIDSEPLAAAAAVTVIDPV